MRRLAYSRLGPFERATILRTPPDHDFLYAVTIALLDSGNRRPKVAAGGGLSFGRARSAAMGEAIERHAVRNWAARKTRLLEASRIPEAHVEPRSLLHYPDAAFAGNSAPLERHDSDEPIYWLEGTGTSRGHLVLVPAFAVFADAQAQRPGYRKPIDAPISTGCACARTFCQSQLGGLYEVIERDAFMLHWENRQGPAPSPCDASTAPLAGLLAARGFRLHVGQLATDTRVPVALAVVEDMRGGRAAIALGAAARATWAAASYRAVEEAVLTSFWISSLKKDGDGSLDQLDEEMNGLPTPARHAYLYGFAEMKPAATFLWAFSDLGYASDDICNRQSHLDTAVELELLSERVRAVGGNPVTVDLTDEFAEAFGCRVSRTLVPEFIPLARGRHFRPTRNMRLTRLPALFPGFRSAANFNPDPHPFP